MAKIDYSQITNRQKLIIDEVIDNFDFEKVHEHMINTNWTWVVSRDEYCENYQYAVPSINRLKRRLRIMLVDAYTNISKHPELKEAPYITSCGGFTVFVWSDDTCHVFFSIAEMDIDRDYIEVLED